MKYVRELLVVFCLIGHSGKLCRAEPLEKRVRRELATWSRTERLGGILVVAGMVSVAMYLGYSEYDAMQVRIADFVRNCTELADEHRLLRSAYAYLRRGCSAEDKTIRF